MNVRKFFLLALLALLLGMAYMMVKPFLGYLVGGVILAFILKPLQNRLSNYLPNKVSAIIVVFFGLAVTIVPFVLAGAAVMEDARGLGQDINTTDFVDIGEIEQRIEEATGRQVDIQSNIDRGLEEFSNRTLGGFSQFLSFIATFTIGITLMLFIMYYLVLEGEKFVKWIKEVTPLPSDIQSNLYRDINKTTWAVIKGHVLVAIVQGLVAGLGLAVTGVPNYAFWTFVMILLGFIPIIGTIIVWAPASVYLFLVGEPVSALILAIYGFVIVGLTDNILRPLAVDRSANLHPAVIIVGVIGGVYLFGAAGLFIGPIILGILKSTLLVFKNNYQDL